VSKPDGGPAFPTGELRSLNAMHERYGNMSGMTLRDYFAAAVVIGGIAHPRSNTDAIAHAQFAYEVADAMLAERDK